MSRLGVDGIIESRSADCGQQTAEPVHTRSSCPATIDSALAAQTEWDIAVIGAGPAGALAARQAALAGLRTLLVDKSAFPRAKVCGGCISGVGRRLLTRIGLGELVEEPAAMPVSRLELAANGRRVSLGLPLGAAVSRDQIDAALVRHAVVAGAEFLPETTAHVRGLRDLCRWRTMTLQGATRKSAVTRSRLIVAADGLGRSSLKRHGPFAPRVEAASRVGLGATLAAGDCGLPPGVISMCVGREGYVGLVRVPGDRINLAAAVDPRAVRQRGPADVVRSILAETRVDPPAGLECAEFRGTGLLTRSSPRVAGKRLLLLGDAAGYVEPFTGDGMTGAMLSAMSIARLAAKWLKQTRHDRRQLADLAGAWKREQRSLMARRQRDCRFLAHFLRHPVAVRAALAVLSGAPRIAQPFIHYFWNDKDVP